MKPQPRQLSDVLLVMPADPKRWGGEGLMLINVQTHPLGYFVLDSQEAMGLRNYLSEAYPKEHDPPESP